ncbi:MAG: hypothetical protein WC804_11165 [Sphingomonas sp.]|jgi:hypothetical protein|uniref:hypothetical protein n=1 Tax=Sphingomonas sp. TaxID=28214 RepID=UPI003564BA29
MVARGRDDGRRRCGSGAPANLELRLSVARLLLEKGKPTLARVALSRSATGVHGGKLAILTTNALKTLDKAGAGAALAMLRDATLPH